MRHARNAQGAGQAMVRWCIPKGRICELSVSSREILGLRGQVPAFPTRWSGRGHGKVRGRLTLPSCSQSGGMPPQSIADGRDSTDNSQMRPKKKGDASGHCHRSAGLRPGVTVPSPTNAPDRRSALRQPVELGGGAWMRPGKGCDQKQVKQVSSAGPRTEFWHAPPPLEQCDSVS